MRLAFEPKKLRQSSRWLRGCAMLALPAMTSAAIGQALPWMDPTLAPDQRAALLVGALSLDQKIQQLHGASGTVPSQYARPFVPITPSSAASAMLACSAWSRHAGQVPLATSDVIFLS